jgi:hypothetical protein
MNVWFGGAVRVNGNASGPEFPSTGTRNTVEAKRISGGGSTGSGFEVFARAGVEGSMSYQNRDTTIRYTGAGQASRPIDDPTTTTDDLWFAILFVEERPTLNIDQPLYATITNAGSVRALVDATQDTLLLQPGAYPLPIGELLVTAATPTASWSIDTTIRLSLTPPPGFCDPLDFNQNSLFPEDQDLIDLLSVLAGGSCSPGNTCNDIDFNNDGLFPADDDLVAFLRVLAGGSCN